ncbi:NAD(P)-dependent alcohol dehydrogenase [Synechococcus sp. RSCCF101]|uniref:NAD(P)-dependent alcohol dehydrogenase n=1 Tax=Synechococcus sp. RSCCF101 TaxID=2511069 RepID=UPI0012462098|nr:NAD(P)-dependent alcohol dehydrogenase [Synechococcus sp. RSCCF101]QEY32697.1 NAD(P)-dependent alcohol dehydrogenase [Synechococcus sp. RSCCF101]
MLITTAARVTRDSLTTQETTSVRSLYFDRYGNSEVLSLRDVAKPELQPGRVLVQVHAASVNPLDWRLMKAEPFLVRLSLGLLKPKHTGLGADFSGVVEAVADDVPGFAAGDAVCGLMAPDLVGSFAEFALVSTECLVHKPASLTHQQACALGVAGLTAYQGIHDYRAIQHGDRVMINGASGGIGTFAIPMAKALGAHVTAVCSGRNHDLVRALGADRVIDYQREDITELSETFDLVFDLIGQHRPSRMKRLLSENGKLVLASAADGWGFLRAMLVSQKDDAVELIVELEKSASRLQQLIDCVVTHQIEPVLDRTYALDDVIEAIDYVATKRARGKVVISIRG